MLASVPVTRSKVVAGSLKMVPHGGSPCCPGSQLRGGSYMNKYRDFHGELRWSHLAGVPVIEGILNFISFVS